MKNKFLQVFFTILLSNFFYFSAYSIEQFSFDITEIEILNDGNIIKGSKKGTVQTNDGITITQSGAIQQYITDKTGKLGGLENDRYEILRWVLWDNHKMSSQAGILRFLSNFLPKEKRPQGAMDFLKGRLQGAYKVLDDALSSKDWLVGDCISVADISCCGYLFYEEPFGFNRYEWKNIDTWLTRISEQPGWKHPYDLMKRAYTNS